MKILLLSLTFLSLTGVGFAQEIKKSVPDLVSEERKKSNVKSADSIAQDYIDNHLFKLSNEELMTQDNLLFISENLNHTDSEGFRFFYKNRIKVNMILGPDKAEYALRYAIARAFIPKSDLWNTAKPDWSKLVQSLKSKFGAIGQEAVYGRAMRYYIHIKDWNTAGKYYILYFKTALKRPEFNINDITWPLFENVSDQEVLRFACDVVMKYAMERWYQMDFNAYDTYANLLYKIGRKEQAIEWEERAVKLSNQGKAFVETLEKMKNNQRTWLDEGNN